MTEINFGVSRFSGCWIRVKICAVSSTLSRELPRVFASSRVVDRYRIWMFVGRRVSGPVPILFLFFSACRFCRRDREKGNGGTEDWFLFFAGACCRRNGGDPRRMEASPAAAQVLRAAISAHSSVSTAVFVCVHVLSRRRRLKCRGAVDLAAVVSGVFVLTSRS